MTQYFFHWTLSLGMTAATSLALGLFVLLHTHGRPFGRLFALWCLSVMWWSGGELLMITRSTAEDTIFWGRTLQAGDIFLPALFLHFVGMLVERPLRRWVLITLYTAASAWAALIMLTPWVITYASKTHPISAHFEIPGPLYLPMLTLFLGQCVAAMFLLFRACREARGQARLRFGYYLTGTVIGFVGGCMNFLPVYGLDSLPALYVYGTYGVPVYVGMTAYAIVRHRFFDISIVLPKSLATGLLIGSISLIAVVLIPVTHRVTLTVAPLLVVGLLVFVISLRMMVRYPRSAAHVRMGVLCWIVTLWLFTVFMMQTSHQVKDALWWHHLTWIAIVFIPACAYHFATAVSPGRQPATRLLLTLYVAGAGFALTSPTVFFTDELYSYSSGIAPRAGPFFPIYLGYLLVAGTLTLHRLHQEYRQRLDTQDPETSRSHAIFWGVAFGGLGAVDALQHYGMNTYPLGLFGVILWICLVTSALSARPVETSVVNRIVAAHDLQREIGAILVCYLLMVSTIRVATGGWYFIAAGVLVATTALCASAMLGMRQSLERRVMSRLFRHAEAQQHAITACMKDMLITLNLHTLKTNILQNVATVMRTPQVALFLLNADKTDYVLAATLQDGAWAQKIGPIPPHSVFAEYIRQSEAVIIRETGGYATSASKDPELAVILTMLADLQAELCCPLSTGHHFLGFLVLGPKEDSRRYSLDELTLLSTLVQTAAIALLNAQFYEDLKQSELLANQSKHLRSLTTMAGGFAHEIRNPLTSIKTFLQVLRRHKDDPEFMPRFMRTVTGDVARIERLITELFNCSKSMNPLLRKENLHSIVTSCLTYVHIKAEEQGITVQVDLAEDLPLVWIDAQRLTQVLTNILLNALEAMTTGPGHLLIQTHRLPKGGELWVQIEVTDTGCGIKPEDLDHIFDPFFTTKHTRREWEGTGLGLTIVDQIVRQHGGYIDVSSQSGQGATFVINIPADARTTIAPTRESIHAKPVQPATSVYTRGTQTILTRAIEELDIRGLA